MSFFFNQPDPKRRRFPIPNDVWKWELKPQGFAILAYLCYLHVHCNKNASIATKMPCPVRMKSHPNCT